MPQALEAYGLAWGLIKGSEGIVFFRVLCRDMIFMPYYAPKPQYKGPCIVEPGKSPVWNPLRELFKGPYSKYYCP